jgi:hypothetical protein
VKVWAPTVVLDPVKVGAELVPAGVPALTAWERFTAELVELAVVVTVLAAARLVPVPKTEDARNRITVALTLCSGNSWAWVANAEPVKTGAATVPSGVMVTEPFVPAAVTL